MIFWIVQKSNFFTRKINFYVQIYINQINMLNNKIDKIAIISLIYELSIIYIDDFLICCFKKHKTLFSF